MLCKELRSPLTVVLLSFFFLAPFSCSRQAVYPSPPLAGTDVIIDVSGLQPEVPKFYTYSWKNRRINFFVLLIDGRVSVFLDACASCYPRKRGYTYDNGAVVCKECGIRLSVYKLKKGLGGCFPVGIEGSVINGKYHIPVSALRAEEDKF